MSLSPHLATSMILWRRGNEPHTEKLEIVTIPNQDPPRSPIYINDIWHYAFNFQYHTINAEYLTAIT
ncbi:hypothetical protein K466DRAFT_668305 [Polyporus arcularius HHB13444]|uniref:Manganese/iron superoxide dismutase C-terminal domain-containing protein n=1 Tax=Polyporus arcularius HHB13444 TaxID=1314778 RepID=A0A5C3NMZ8_9APHY|nr:hypothetical protein K466DRAFT_668305 [Polyporus arcularius HHB13444]